MRCARHREKVKIIFLVISCWDLTDTWNHWYQPPYNSFIFSFHKKKKKGIFSFLHPHRPSIHYLSLRIPVLNNLFVLEIHRLGHFSDMSMPAWYILLALWWLHTHLPKSLKKWACFSNLMVEQIESYHLMSIYVPGNVWGAYTHYSSNPHVY